MFNIFNNLIMKYKFNKVEVEDLLFNQKLKIKEAAERLGCTTIALQRYMRKEQIRIAKRYTQAQKDAVLQLLDTGLYKHIEIANKLGMALTEVRSIIKQRSAKEKEDIKFPNQVSDDFIKNKPLFWYLVGIVITDGHLVDRSANVTIYQNNYHFLECLQKLIGHSGKIREGRSETGRMYSLAILNKTFYNFLLSNGLDFDKRYSAKFIKCPDKYMPYYIRGIFDGDGCLAYRYISGRFEGKVIQITTGSLDIANALNTFFQKQNWNSTIHNKVSIAGNPYYDITIDDTENVLKFCKYIYSGELTFKLERKYYKYIKLEKLIELDKQINEIVDTLEKSKEV